MLIGHNTIVTFSVTDCNGTRTYQGLAASVGVKGVLGGRLTIEAELTQHVYSVTSELKMEGAGIFGAKERDIKAPRKILYSD